MPVLYKAIRALIFAPNLSQKTFAEDKLKIAQKLCEQHGADIKQAFAYGNSYNDRMILDAVGHPVAVTPDRRLRKLAWRKGWKIIDPV